MDSISGRLLKQKAINLGGDGSRNEKVSTRDTGVRRNQEMITFTHRYFLENGSKALEMSRQFMYVSPCQSNAVDLECDKS